jgi:hypothetical protein
LCAQIKKIAYNHGGLMIDSSITRWHLEIALIELSMLFFNISATELRAVTPYLSPYNTILTYLLFERNVLGRLLWEDASEEILELF